MYQFQIVSNPNPNQIKSNYNLHTVEPVLSGHPWGLRW